MGYHHVRITEVTTERRSPWGRIDRMVGGVTLWRLESQDAKRRYFECSDALVGSWELVFSHGIPAGIPADGFAAQTTDLRDRTPKWLLDSTTREK